MYFQFNPPSIHRIRAKFIIEALSNYPNSINSINLFVTGRTGSGKTTLGNRFLGIDYFLSTGHQDCTKEVNLIEFPIGLKYFDLPGVCSDDLLENFNRVALGVAQVEDFPWVETLNVAKFAEDKPPQEQNLTIKNFRNLSLEPDLIFYLIAPDKQFGRSDRKYLRDLLKCHHQVIYVFNMFVNKDKGTQFAATEANITDAASQITKVHTSIVGQDPIIIPVNCLTGEGISDLLTQSQILLGGEKGKAFKQAIEYQRQQTPEEYLKQFHQELLRLLAHAACQKPDGSYSCQQPIHKDAHILLEILTNLRKKSEAVSCSFGKDINSLIQEAIENVKANLHQKSNLLEEEIAQVVRGYEIIQDGINLVNDKINSHLFDFQKDAIKSRDELIEKIKQGIKSRSQKVEFLEQDLNLKFEDYSSFKAKVELLTEEVNSVYKELEAQFNAINFQEFELMERINNFNSRKDRYEARVDNYNSNIDEINTSWGTPTEATIQSLDAEKKYIIREKAYLQSEGNDLDEKVSSLNERHESLNKKARKLDEKSQRRNQMIQELDIKREIAIEIVKEYNQLKKGIVEDVSFSEEAMDRFNSEFWEVNDQIHQRIDEINQRISIIRENLTELITEEGSFNEAEIPNLQDRINSCIDEMSLFLQEISTFQTQISLCLARININIAVNNVVIKYTNYHFNETDDFSYKGSTHDFYKQDGIAILLTIANLIFYEREDNNFDAWHNSFFTIVNNLGDFPAIPREDNVLKLLSSDIKLLFSPPINDIIKKVAS